MIDTDKYEGHHICVECGSDEIPLSVIDGGETGLTDYFFSCSKCNFSWYVAVRTDEHEDGVSVGIDFIGFMDEDGNLTWKSSEEECAMWECDVKQNTTCHLCDHCSNHCFCVEVTA